MLSGEYYPLFNDSVSSKGMNKKLQSPVLDPVIIQAIQNIFCRYSAANNLFSYSKNRFPIRFLPVLMLFRNRLFLCH